MLFQNCHLWLSSTITVIEIFVGNEKSTSNQRRIMLPIFVLISTLTILYEHPERTILFFCIGIRFIDLFIGPLLGGPHMV